MLVDRMNEQKTRYFKKFAVPYIHNVLNLGQHAFLITHIFVQVDSSVNVKQDLSVTLQTVRMVISLEGPEHIPSSTPTFFELPDLVLMFAGQPLVEDNRSVV